jgi:tetratricopeptide (TPR) repeat protein
MIKHITSLVLIFTTTLLVSACLAQNTKKADSLRNLLSEVENSNRLEILQSLSRDYLFGSIDSCLKYCHLAIETAVELNKQVDIASAYKKIGYAYYRIGEYDSSLIYFYEGRKYAMLANDHLEYAIITNLIGDTYTRLSDYPKAINSFTVAERKCDSLLIKNQDIINVKRLFSIIFMNLGIVYHKLDSLNKPLIYFEKALFYANQIDDSVRVCASLSNIGMILRAKDKYKEALTKYFESLRISNMLGNEGYSQATLNNIANIYIDLNKPDSAIFYLESALEIAKRKNDQYGRSLILRNISGLYQKNNQNSEALKTGIEAYTSSLNSNSAEQLYLSSQNLATVYSALGKYDSAFKYFVKYHELRDEVKGNEALSQIAEIREKYEAEKKENENKALKQTIKYEKEVSNYLLIISIGLFLLGIMSLILFYFVRRNANTKKKLVESEAARLEGELESRNRELTIGALSLSRNLEFINSLIEELNNLTDHVDDEGVRPLQNIVKKLSSQQSDVSWKEFEKRFSEVHSGFYDNLLEKYPNLTHNELRLCAFLKLGMSTKEICAITFQSIRAVEAGRLRLRKKLNLQTHENLSVFLQKVY